MNDPIREAFEKSSSSISWYNQRDLERLASGRYRYSVVEERWQTFQEGWEAATESAVKVLDALDKVNGNG